jgi:hypothetical protein
MRDAKCLIKISLQAMPVDADDANNIDVQVEPPAVVPEAVAPATRRARVMGAAPTRRSQRLAEKERMAALVLEQEEAAGAPATTAVSGPRGRALRTPNTRAAAPAKKASKKRKTSTQATRSQLADDGEPLWKTAKRPDDLIPADGLRRSKRKAAADATQKAYYCVKAKWAVWER